jgi:hypothetical protein
MNIFRANFLFFVVLSLICSVFAQNLDGEKELGACGICTMAVNTLQGYSSKEVSEADILKQLSAISETVCLNVPSEILSKEKCTSFVTLYAPYIVELLFSSTNAQEICGNLGICDSESPQYQILFPTIQNGTVIYSAVENNYKTETQFNYKIFLGNPQFLDDETYTLSTLISDISGSEVSIKVTNRTTFVMNDKCTDKTRCSIDVTKPGKKVWYYISVNVKVNGKEPSFTLNVTEQNTVTAFYWKYQGSHNSALTFAFVFFACILGLCSICLAVTRCMFHQKRIPQRTIEDAEESLLERRSPAFIEPINHTPMLVFLPPNNMPMGYTPPNNMPMGYAPPQHYLPYTVNQ